ncbi:hypothetical protein SDC9_126369 [bioreactor metagenome]|uniref:Uncharacterized protein n=1 Tax=bioreactor metagenome TaxID=1076179 RepID=A0A645CQJ0_9ZZZZ
MRPAVEVLVPLAAGIAEVGVQVDEPGGQQASAALDHLRALAGEIAAQPGDFAVLHKEAVLFYEFFAVEYFKIFEEKFFHYLAPPPQR